ncbi:MAG: PEGA domain-containing protein [Methanocalculaceae archaeon]|nr:PEGA domain-containing protein [Methanocalculaceae archaeon]
MLVIPAVLADEPVSKLTIDSIPGGADVRVSDMFVGYSPVTVEVAGGSTVSVLVQRNGGSYDIWRGSVYVPKGEHITYTARLYLTEDKIRTTGYLSVRSNAEGAEVYLDNGYIGTITNGTLARDEVKLGLHQVVVRKDGYTGYTDLVEVKPKNIATTNVDAVLVPVSSGGADVPTTAGTQSSATVPPAPTKSPVCAVLPVIALLGVGAVLRR